MYSEIKPPETWPEPPPEMSVSSLRAIESCPRRWALSTASYPELWQGVGYPPRTQRSWLTGNVVHGAIERIVRSLAQADCGSLSDPCAPAVIRELGGFTSILRSCIEETVARQAENPRLPDIEDFRISLERSMARMRVDVQSLLRTLPLVPTNRSHGSPRHTGVRGPLGPGTYGEVEVRAPTLHWRGFVDLLVLEPDGTAEIRDFKTGIRSDDHEFQVKAYAVLWSSDNDLNPSGALPTRLTLSYPNGDVTVPVPSAQEADAIKAELRERATAARGLASTHPPEARPSFDTCKRCDVRHLCSEYWQADTQRRLAAEVDEAPPFGDLQVRVLSRRGPVTWDAVVEQSDRFENDTPLTVLAPGGHHRLDDGAVLRILDARMVVTTPDEAEDRPDVPVASLTSTSEVFVLS